MRVVLCCTQESPFQKGGMPFFHGAQDDEEPANDEEEEEDDEQAGGFSHKVFVYPLICWICQNLCSLLAFSDEMQSFGFPSWCGRKKMPLTTQPLLRRQR